MFCIKVYMCTVLKMKDLSAYLTTVKRDYSVKNLRIKHSVVLIVYYQAQLESELALFQSNPPSPKKSWIVSLNRI